MQEYLHSGESFVAQFVTRCQERAVDDRTQGLYFDFIPDSQTNKLYADIAELLFPNEAARILLPRIKTVLKADTADEIPPHLTAAQKKEYYQAPPIEIRTLPINTVQSQDLIYYALGETEMIDVRSLSYFNLDMHRKLYLKLTEHYPKLKPVLYRHNVVLHELEDDLLFMESKGLTPKEAFKRLIKGLFLGGTRVTGQAEAGKAAKAAYLAFLYYFNKLPEEVKVKLKALKGKKSITAVLDWLRRDECVETAADDLNDVLQKNAGDPYLNTPIAASKELVDELTKKYSSRNLTAGRDSVVDLDLCGDLLDEVMSEISPNNLEEMTNFLLNFSPNFYMLHFATNSDEAFMMVFALYSKKEQKSAVLSLDLEKKNVAHYAAQSPKIMTLILGCLSYEEQYKLVQDKDANQCAVLNYAVAYPEALYAILSVFTLEDRLRIMESNWTFLKSLGCHSDSLRMVFSLLPQQERLAFFKRYKYFFKNLIERESFRREVLDSDYKNDTLNLYCIVLHVLHDFKVGLTWSSVLGLFSSLLGYRTQTQKLCNDLDKCTTDKEIKAVLHSFLHLTAAALKPIQQKLIDNLVWEPISGNYEEKKEYLRQEWQIEAKPSASLRVNSQSKVS